MQLELNRNQQKKLLGILSALTNRRIKPKLSDRIILTIDEMDDCLFTNIFKTNNPDWDVLFIELIQNLARPLESKVTSLMDCGAFWFRKFDIWIKDHPEGTLNEYQSDYNTKFNQELHNTVTRIVREQIRELLLKIRRPKNDD